jgi:predicted nucleic acid-binding Zn ribbon protein
MSIGPKRTCPVCREKYAPIQEWQVCCTPKCANVLRVRRFRARKQGGGDDGGGGGKRRQLALFSKESVSAKRIKQPRPETAPLFTMSATGKHEKHLYPVPVIGHWAYPPFSSFSPSVCKLRGLQTSFCLRLHGLRY